MGAILSLTFFTLFSFFRLLPLPFLLQRPVLPPLPAHPPTIVVAVISDLITSQHCINTSTLLHAHNTPPPSLQSPSPNSSPSSSSSHLTPTSPPSHRDLQIQSSISNIDVVFSDLTFMASSSCSHFQIWSLLFRRP
ncbi:hypothetical protein MtrunA17_Chr7g0258761 [Medicago truncatula]|uniref:Transmembrane protein n=1 Tax=Medicago truncatula TaxID=3880 RepID=G7KVE6_MEDTR|nr:hypothetical protein MTR_7g093320 [Medicago truncatula]RHN47972.1 hypothetical protein MtrunA17_Chr7g0258761 [Medicago truncatula]